MLGLLLIYFIGKSFYTLAEEHDKSQWAFAILGVITYYGGSFIFGIAFVFFFSYQNPAVIENMDDLVLGFIAMPAGLLACWGVYRLLKNKWEQEVLNGNSGMQGRDILDDDF